MGGVPGFERGGGGGAPRRASAAALGRGMAAGVEPGDKAWLEASGAAQAAELRRLRRAVWGACQAVATRDKRQRAMAKKGGLGAGTGADVGGSAAAASVLGDAKVREALAHLPWRDGVAEEG